MGRKPILYSRIVRSDEVPKLVSFLIEMKVVRSETQAMFFLMFCVAVFSCFAVYFFLSATGGLIEPTAFSVFPTEEYSDFNNNL